MLAFILLSLHFIHPFTFNSIVLIVRASKSLTLESVWVCFFSLLLFWFADGVIWQRAIDECSRMLEKGVKAERQTRQTMCVTKYYVELPTTLWQFIMVAKFVLLFHITVRPQILFQCFRIDTSTKLYVICCTIPINSTYFSIFKSTEKNNNNNTIMRLPLGCNLLPPKREWEWEKSRHVFLTLPFHAILCDYCVFTIDFKKASKFNITANGEWSTSIACARIPCIRVKQTHTHFELRKMPAFSKPLDFQKFYFYFHFSEQRKRVRIKAWLSLFSLLVHNVSFPFDWFYWWQLDTRIPRLVSHSLIQYLSHALCFNRYWSLSLRRQSDLKVKNRNENKTLYF